jgi:hypothetical protein
MDKCQTSVETGLKSPMFKACGKPVEESVSVGVKRCNYCAEHAAAARRYVDKQGQATIAATQHRMRTEWCAAPGDRFARGADGGAP